MEIDKIGTCRTCHLNIEHFAGIPGSRWQTPYWRHVDTEVPAHPHPAAPIHDSIQEVHQ